MFTSSTFTLLSIFSYYYCRVSIKCSKTFIEFRLCWIIKYVLRVFAPCLALSVVKIFHSTPKSYDPQYNYPFSSSDLYQHISETLLYVYLSFEFSQLFCVSGHFACCWNETNSQWKREKNKSQRRNKHLTQRKKSLIIKIYKNNLF